MKITIDFPDDLPKAEIERRLYQLQQPTPPSTIEARVAVNLRETIDDLRYKVSTLETTLESIVFAEELIPRINSMSQKLRTVELEADNGRAALLEIGELREDIRKIKIKQTKQKAGYIQRIESLRDSLGANHAVDSDELRHTSGDITAETGDTERD